MDTQSPIESLLYEEEGPELDFKQEQYKFEGIDDKKKSELLKDVISFANAWRRADAYILIGVQEVKGGRSIVLGVSNHLEDAQIQQFINSKTNRPVDFSYTPIEFEGKQIALIRIPQQERPIFLTRDFGSLQRNQVYLRRGSSTDIARPDEIARMGLLTREDELFRPLLSPLLIFGKDGEFQGKNAEFATTPLLPPDVNSIPDFKYPRQYGPGGFALPSLTYLENNDYYRDKAEYVRYYSSLRPVRFGVTNGGTAVANDVKLVITVLDPKREFELSHQRKRPDRPQKDHTFAGNLVSQLSARPSDIECSYVRNGWRVIVKLGKIQAKDMVISQEVLYIGRKTSGVIEMAASIFSDDLSSPVQEVLSMSYEVTPSQISLDRLVG